MPSIVLSSFLLCLMLWSTAAWHLSHNFYMPNDHHIVKRNAKINYTQILDFWQKHESELVFQANYREVVLVVGNTGAGKSTLASALTGKKLIATQPKGQTYLVFVDEEKRVGTGLSSHTIIPEVMTDNERNITYVDCPGFKDNRDIEYEIFSAYFQNFFMHQVEKMKIVLVVNYDSLKSNGNKNDFDDLLDHVSQLFKNILKFRDGLALVATKVEYLWDFSTPIPTIYKDSFVLNGIADFLLSKKNIYREKTENIEKWSVFADLIDALLEKKNESYTRITIFRQPKHAGEITKLPDTMRVIKNIINVITDNLHYVKKNKDDFGLSLTTSTKIAVDHIIDDIFRNALMNRLHVMGNETYKHYLQMEKQHRDIEIIQEQISQAYGNISQIKYVDNPLKLFQEFLATSNSLNISVSQTNLDDISDDIRKLQFFTTVLDGDEDIYMLLLKEGLQNVIDLIGNLKKIYDFLNNLHKNLGTYESQILKNDARIKKITSSCANLQLKAAQNITALEEIVTEIDSDEKYQEIKTLELNRVQLQHIRTIFDFFTHNHSISCTPKQLIVKGYNIKMSDVIKIDCWPQAKNIRVFALNKIFIDVLVNKEHQDAEMFILAPTWEIIGKPMIILNGRPGNLHFQRSAGMRSDGRGMDGDRGLPGGSGGHFFGVGKKFINPVDLEIHTNGGQGGPGQEGGHGMDGQEGETLSRSFFETSRTPQECREYFRYHDWPSAQVFSASDMNHDRPNLWYAVIFGKDAERPHEGGDGGIGGIGGYPGTVSINGLGKSVNISIFNSTGPRGDDGRGGSGGSGTYKGLTVSFHIVRNIPLLNWWHYEEIEYINTSEYRAVLRVSAAMDGRPGWSTANTIHPTKLSMTSPHFAINGFKFYILENLWQSVTKAELTSLYFDLENPDYIKAEYNTPGFVQEFQELETQYLKLKNQIDFNPFYNSLLSRIEKFSLSEQSLENKKVLSFIYTAALTKLLTLKKKRTGKTVVNLQKYLDTIQVNVKDLQETSHLQSVQNYRNEYNNTLTKKIQEANDLIQKNIEPDISNLIKQSDDQIKIIINEIREKERSTVDDIKHLQSKKKSIRRTMQLHSILGPLKIVVSCLSVFGAISSGVGFAITSIGKVAAGLFVGSSSDKENDETPPIHLNSKLISQIKKTLEHKPTQLIRKINRALTYLKENHKKSLENSGRKISTLRKIDDLERKIRKIKKTTPQTVREVTAMHNDAVKVESELIEFMNMEENLLKEELRRSENSKSKQNNTGSIGTENDYKQWLNQLKTAKSILKTIQVVSDVQEELNDDDSKMKDINDLISQHGQELENLENMENQIYETVIPDLLQIEMTVNALMTSTEQFSHAKRDLSKWKVRTTLEEIKSLLQKLTYNMPLEIKSNFERLIEKINEGFSVLIDVYDRIDSYSDSVKQAEYIAHIQSVPMNEIQVTDPELERALLDLTLTIHSNLLIEKYEIALHAFKQHYFPFAAHVLQRYELPMGMRFDDTETLRQSLINKIEDMKIHIDEGESTLSEYSKFIHEDNVFNSDTSGSSPFYIWEHETFGKEIQRLLNGTEVLMKADIFVGPQLNAVKYTDIGIRFKLKNETLQNNFTSVLKNFALIMTMVGNNYYRCSEQYYYISFDDDITISYTLDQDETKNWINSNLVYATIRRSHAFLSPYGMWSIKLKKINETMSWDQMHVFGNEPIDLELVGRGYYIEQNPKFNFDICNEYLNTFYNVENVVKVLK